jgi:hypothetical protein
MLPLDHQPWPEDWRVLLVVILAAAIKLACTYCKNQHTPPRKPRKRTKAKPPAKKRRKPR